MGKDLNNVVAGVLEQLLKGNYEGIAEEKVENFMLSIKVNGGMTEKLIRAGLPHVFRSKAEQERLTALYAQEAGKKKAFRLNRTDTAGNKQADGGDLRFGQAGQENLFPGAAIPDLERDGYKLIVAEIFQKQNDCGDGFLRLVYALEGNAITVGEEARQLIALLTGRFYRKCYAYYNDEALSLHAETDPVKGSIITLNFGGPMQNPELTEKATALRYLRIDDGCHLRTVPVPAAK